MNAEQAVEDASISAGINLEPILATAELDTFSIVTKESVTVGNTYLLNGDWVSVCIRDVKLLIYSVQYVEMALNILIHKEVDKTHFLVLKEV